MPLPALLPNLFVLLAPLQTTVPHLTPVLCFPGKVGGSTHAHTPTHLFFQHHPDGAFLVQLLAELNHLSAQVLSLLILPDVW